MKLYEELKMADVLGPISALLDNVNSGIVLDANQQIFLKTRRSPSTPWLNIKTDARLCGKWAAMYFKYYNFIPKGCRKCWKIVWTGKTIKELFKIREIQKEMDMVSKCGVEQRPWSGKLGYYQGFWYAPLDGGLKGARELHKKVLERLSKEPVLMGPEVILKRGCTEMENRYSPSDTWEAYAKKFNWDIKEAFCDSVFLDDPEKLTTGKAVGTSVKLTWLTYAWEHRDPTVGDYMERPPLEPMMQYQRSIHSESDFAGWEGNGDGLKINETVDKGNKIALIQ